MVSCYTGIYTLRTSRLRRNTLTDAIPVPLIMYTPTSKLKMFGQFERHDGSQNHTIGCSETLCHTLWGHGRDQLEAEDIHRSVRCMVYLQSLNFGLHTVWRQFQRRYGWQSRGNGNAQERERRHRWPIHSLLPLIPLTQLFFRPVNQNPPSLPTTLRTSDNSRSPFYRPRMCSVISLAMGGGRLGGWAQCIIHRASTQYTSTKIKFNGEFI